MSNFPIKTRKRQGGKSDAQSPSKGTIEHF